MERPAVRPPETEIIRSGFLPVEEILAGLSQVETRSQICMAGLFGGQQRLLQ